MVDQTYEEKITELMRLVGEGTHVPQRIDASAVGMPASLDWLRLSIKYLVFDLEATRRENAYLRRLVEEVKRDDSPQWDPDDEMIE